MSKKRFASAEKRSGCRRSESENRETKNSTEKTSTTMWFKTSRRLRLSTGAARKTSPKPQASTNQSKTKKPTLNPKKTLSWKTWKSMVTSATAGPVKSLLGQEKGEADPKTKRASPKADC